MDLTYSLLLNVSMGLHYFIDIHVSSFINALAVIGNKISKHPSAITVSSGESVWHHQHWWIYYCANQLGCFVGGNSYCATWHHTLGHINYDVLNKLARDEHSSVSNSPRCNTLCKPCLLAKIHKSPYPSCSTSTPTSCCWSSKTSGVPL